MSGVEPTQAERASIDRRRGGGWGLLVAGLALVVSFVGVESFGFEWLRILGVHPFVYGPVGALLLVLLFVVWRCPRCRRHLGRLDSRFCTHCGLALTRDPAHDLRGRTDPDRVHRELDHTRRALDRLESIGPLVFLVGFAVGCGLFYLLEGVPASSLGWAGLLVLGVAAGATLRALVHNVTLLRHWRCPACRSHLPFERGRWFKIVEAPSGSELGACPSCRVDLSGRGRS